MKLTEEQRRARSDARKVAVKHLLTHSREGSKIDSDFVRDRSEEEAREISDAELADAMKWATGMLESLLGIIDRIVEKGR